MHPYDHMYNILFKEWTFVKSFETHLFAGKTRSHIVNPYAQIHNVTHLHNLYILSQIWFHPWNLEKFCSLNLFLSFTHSHIG